MNLFDLAREALIGALDDGEITADDFREWKKFKRRTLRQVRGLFKEVEDGGISMAPEDAALLLAILARMR